MKWRRIVVALALSLALCIAAQAERSGDETVAIVESYLSSMQCPGACSYVMAIIDLYPKTRNELLALGDDALPALANVLAVAEPGRYRDMAEIFLMEILARRVPSDLETANETIAIAAIEAYTGKPYKAIAPNPNWPQ